MSGRRKITTGAGSPQRKSRAGRSENDAAPPMPLAHPGRPQQYADACRLAGEGQYEEARRIYARLNRGAAKKDARLRGLIQNDLAVLDAVAGKFEEAREGWQRALEADGDLLLARLNRDLVEAEISLAGGQEELEELKLVPAPGAGAGGWDPLTRPSGTLSPSLTPRVLRGPLPEGEGGRGQLAPASSQSPVAGSLSSDGSGRVSYLAARAASVAVQGSSHHAPRDVYAVDEERKHHAERDDYLGSARVSDPAVRQTGGFHDLHAPSSDGPIRVAILSLLFNWPSTGGGNMHTAGLVEFLKRGGYDTRHFFARYPAWGIGRVAADGLVASEALEFDEPSWNVAEIQRRYRRVVDEFQPDFVAITDAWNMKPLLAEAMRGYPVLLLFQAQECLCPLNNLRLLGVGPDQVEQCPRNQLATPQVCHGCLAQRGQHSGALHQVERALAGVGTAEYDQKLRRSLLEAEALLALNPLTAAMLEPFAQPGLCRSVGD